MTGLRTALAAAALAAVCMMGTAAAADPEATSADGRWRVRGDGATVQVFDAGRLAKTLPARNLQGDTSAPPRAVRYLNARRSFVIAFDAPMRELWELSVDPDAPPVHDGLVHDWRLGEAIPTPGFLGVRRTPLEGTSSLRALAADARGGPFVLAQSAEGEWLLINLDVRRVIGRYVMEGVRE